MRKLDLYLDTKIKNSNTYIYFVTFIWSKIIDTKNRRGQQYLYSK